MVVTHLVPGVGVKAGNGAGVAELADGPAEQGDCFAGGVENALLAAGEGGVERLGQVDEQQHADVAAVRAVADIDARLGKPAALPVGPGTQRDVEVEFAALFLVAQANPFLRLEQVEQALEAAGEHGMTREQVVDVCRVSRRMQGFVDGCPVGKEALRRGIPFRIVAGRQAGCFRAGRGGPRGELSSSSPDSMKVHR